MPPAGILEVSWGPGLARAAGSSRLLGHPRLPPASPGSLVLSVLPRPPDPRLGPILLQGNPCSLAGAVGEVSGAEGVYTWSQDLNPEQSLTPICMTQGFSVPIPGHSHVPSPPHPQTDRFPTPTEPCAALGPARSQAGTGGPHGTRPAVPSLVTSVTREALSPRPPGPQAGAPAKPRGSCLTRRGGRGCPMSGPASGRPRGRGPHPAPKAPRASPRPLSPHEARERGRGGLASRVELHIWGRGPSGRGGWDSAKEGGW